MSSKPHNRQFDLAPDSSWRARDWCAALALFALTAGVVLWQNTRVTVLWDVSYILENATRMSQGQLPYRDFPFPYAPLTFLTQAAIIKLFGRVFWHHTAYAAIAGGVATVVAWRILVRLLCGRVQHGWAVAFLLAAPCCVLGIYCIVPHPFYDPDCTLVMLLGVLALLQIEDREAQPYTSFRSRAALLGTGALLVVPVFIKQNIGLVFTFTVVAALCLETAFSLRRGERDRARQYVWIVTGALVFATASVALVSATVGLGNYVHWTVRFAASRRLPAWHEMLGVYTNPALGVSLACMFAAVVIMLRVRQAWSRWIAAPLLAAPFLWAVIYLVLDSDASERAERLLAVWPPVMVASFVIAVVGLRTQLADIGTGVSVRTCNQVRGNGMPLRPLALRRWLPFILLATVHAAFLSQQLWGSTYALWPVLMLLIACAMCTLVHLHAERTTPLKQRKLEWGTHFAAIVAVTMLIAGALYIGSEERLSYVNLQDGELVHSSLPALRGMTMRGPWLPDFDELVRFADRGIPRSDGLLMLPGEDLFYFSTGRTPQFPAVMFDHTINPYDSTEELAEAVRVRPNIRWIVVKRELQLNETPMPQKQQLLDLLVPEFELLEKLDNYDVYRRKMR